MALPGAKKAHKVVYIGNDKNFWHTIKSRFTSSYPKEELEFIELKKEETRHAQIHFVDLLKIGTLIVYIDFTNCSEDILLLSELLGQDNSFTLCPIVGLVDTKDNVKEFLSAGVDFIFIKGGELFDIINSPMSMALPKAVKKVKFAKAEMSKDAFIFDDLRVSYITPSYVHVEGNFILKENETVDIDLDLPAKNILSSKFKVKKVGKSDLYYDYSFNYNLDFVFVDEPEFSEDEYDDALGVDDQKKKVEIMKMAKAKRLETIEQYKKDIKQCRKKHKDWVLDNMGSGTEKTTKILIVDKKMRSLEEEGLGAIDKYSVGVRCRSFLSEDFSELELIRPSVIALQMLGEFGADEEKVFQMALEISNLAEDENRARKEEEETVEEEKRAMAIAKELRSRESEEKSFLKNLITKIKFMENYTPILIIYRCYFQSEKAMRESYAYPMLMVHKESLKFNELIEFGKMYESKQKEKKEGVLKEKVANLKKEDPQKYRNLEISDFKEKRYFIRKKNPLSICSLKSPIVIKTMTESEITFVSSLDLPEKTYRMDYPLTLSIHLVPIEDGKLYIEEKGEKLYRALIHSISETDKKALRRYVNDIFFGPLNEKRAEEEQAYWDRHQAALDGLDVNEESLEDNDSNDDSDDNSSSNE